LDRLMEKKRGEEEKREIRKRCDVEVGLFI
jgi:hypothetical protein